MVYEGKYYKQLYSSFHANIAAFMLNSLR